MSDVKVTFVAVDGASVALAKIAASVKQVGTQSDASQKQVSNFGQHLLTIASALGIQTGLQAIVGGIKNIVTSSFDLAAALETSKMAFGTMLGSAEAANKMLDDLRSFADSTPFEFMGLQQAAKRMMAYGFEAEAVIPTLRNLGDAAGALGGGTAMIDRLTLALGQMKAKGKVSGEELMQLSETGIPALKFLADAAGVTTAEMSAMVSKGIVPADQAIRVLLQGMETNFGGLMAKQAETATGKISTLKDAISELKTTTGEGLVPIVIQMADVFTVATKELTAHQAAMNQNATVTDELELALKRGYITAEQFGKAVEFVGLQASTDGLVLFDNTVVDMTYALELATEAQKKHDYQVSISHETFLKQRQRVDKVTEGLDMMKKAIDPAKVALQELNDRIAEHATSFSMVATAETEFQSASEKLAKSQADHQKVVDDLIKGHGGLQAAILGGKGTIIDNTTAIEKADIAHLHLKKRIQDVEERHRDGKISAEDYAIATRENNLAFAEQTEEYNKLTAANGTGKTATELAAIAQGNYNTQLANAKIAVENDILAEQALKDMVAKRLLEEIALEQLKVLAKDGFLKEEQAQIKALSEALGIADSEAITGMFNREVAATELAKLHDKYGEAFKTGNKEQMATYAAMVKSIGDDIANKQVPDMAKAEEAGRKAAKQVHDFANTYNGLQSKEITLTYHEIRTSQGIVLQNTAMAKDGVAVSEPGQSTAVTGLTVDATPRPKSGALATGGPMSGMGGAYLVGEYGPELFDPSGSGRIFSANQLGRAQAGYNANSNMRIDTINMYGVQNPAELYEAISKEARARGKHLVMA